MADRTGSWRMHLQAVTDYLQIFAAVGHFNHLKSAYYYLQEMAELENRHPDVYMDTNEVSQNQWRLDTW